MIAILHSILRKAIGTSDALFLPFVAKRLGKSLDRLTIEDICADTIRQFLLELEQKRGCSISTRNQRLAALHALARFISERNPEHVGMACRNSLDTL